jgi:hypothetical protein
MSEQTIEELSENCAKKENEKIEIDLESTTSNFEAVSLLDESPFKIPGIKNNFNLKD